MKFHVLRIMLFLLLSSPSCNSFEENNNTISESMTDVYNVLHQVINDKNLSIYLDSNIKKKMFVYYRFEELPIHNSLYLSKPNPKDGQTIRYMKNNVEIKYNLNMKNEIDNLVILIEQTIIKGDSASVKIRIPKDAVFSVFKLLKKRKKWVVVNAEVSQT